MEQRKIRAIATTRERQKAAFDDLRRIERIRNIDERRAALESVAQRVQMKANRRARETWRGYALWRSGLDPATPILGLCNPQNKRYRVSRSPVSLRWAGMPWQGYLNALNAALRRAESLVVVQSKHRLICWFLKQAEEREALGIEARGSCPICGGDIVAASAYVGGRGYQPGALRCWHEDLSCNDWLTQKMWREGELDEALTQSGSPARGTPRPDETRLALA
jgi:hypothetical protein